jgi:hypothetical protein
MRIEAPSKCGRQCEPLVRALILVKNDKQGLYAICLSTYASDRASWVRLGLVKGGRAHTGLSVLR